MRTSWRRWLPGPKHGLARGSEVFGPAGFDQPERLASVLGRCARLRMWAKSHDTVLDDTPDSLIVLERHLDVWSTDPEMSSLLSNEVGAYLGTVIVKNVAGAGWKVWPNGHPVVRVPSGTDLDVFAQAHRRVSFGQGTLTSIYTSAQ